MCSFCPRVEFFSNKVAKIKVDDFTKVGSVLGALVATTLFYRRASLLAAIPGGAALGIGGGVIAHLIVNKSEKGPNAMVEELKSSCVPTEALWKDLVSADLYRIWQLSAQERRRIDRSWEDGKGRQGAVRFRLSVVQLPWIAAPAFSRSREVVAVYMRSSLYNFWTPAQCVSHFG